MAQTAKGMRATNPRITMAPGMVVHLGVSGTVAEVRDKSAQIKLDPQFFCLVRGGPRRHALLGFSELPEGYGRPEVGDRLRFTMVSVDIAGNPLLAIHPEPLPSDDSGGFREEDFLQRDDFEDEDE